MLLRPMGFGGAIAILLFFFYVGQYKHLFQSIQTSVPKICLGQDHVVNESTVPIQSAPPEQIYSTRPLTFNATLGVSAMLDPNRLAIAHQT